MKNKRQMFDNRNAFIYIINIFNKYTHCERTNVHERTNFFLFLFGTNRLLKWPHRIDFNVKTHYRNCKIRICVTEYHINPIIPIWDVRRQTRRVDDKIFYPVMALQVFFLFDNNKNEMISNSK